MARKKATRPTPVRKRPPVPPGGATVASWEDDPGDPKSHPPLGPITGPVPNQAAQPLPYKLVGKAPASQIYQPGTINFVYFASASALRRTASFWGGIVPAGTTWQVGNVLAVNIDSGVDLNAFYTRGGGGESPGLHFFHDSVGGRVYFSGESPDVCCHEMGHAVLDALRPQLFDAQTIEAAAFHESFGDMSALLSALQVPSFRQAVLSDTGGSINRASRLSRLAEQLGAAIRVGHPDAVDGDCLRNAANSLFYTDPQTLPPGAPASHLSSEPHSFSRVFTGGFLDALAGMFKLQGGTPSPDGLVQTTQDMARLLVAAVVNASVVPDYYSQVAAQLVQAGEAAPFNGKYRDVLKSAFVRRGILSLQAAATLGGISKEGARIMAMTAAALPSIKTRALPMATISAAQYGLKKTVLKVHTAGEPKHLAVTGSSATIGSAEPRSVQNSAESYTEDLFQRGHVDVGRHAHTTAGLLHPYSFKTHVVVEDGGDLMLRRTTFDCGFHFPFDRLY
jgi:hypothetical protein